MKLLIVLVILPAMAVVSCASGERERASHQHSGVYSFENVDMSPPEQTPYDARQREREAELRSYRQAPPSTAP